jgi:prepilin-type N-terminal cleavage/methylation domain-containing protein
MSRKHTQAGFGLIEILITLVVLGVGLIAIANLQGKLFQNSAAARDRVAAVNLAQKKLEDLRNFTQVEAGAGGVFGYAEIGTNAGGMKADDGTLLLASDTYTIGTTDYTLSWVASDFEYASDNTGRQASASATPDFKRVMVTVSWDGLDGGGEVAITGSVNALSPSSSAQTVAKAAERQGPIVEYQPGAAPDYVPIDIGDTVKKETSTPEPVVSQNAQFTLTSFDEISYDTVFQTQRRDEYITVNCVCQQDGFGDGREPTLEIYDDETERLQTIVGEVVNKRIGARVTTGQYGQQPELCNTCCRDHHDHTASTYKYDPFRPVEPTLADGDHDHYFPDANGVLQLANGANDLYLEACRFKRVDGYLRLMPDWNLATLQIMPALFVSSNMGDYVTYVQDFVEAYVSGITYGSNYPVAYPSPGTTFPNEPLEQSMGVNQTDQLIARGVYIDYMDSDLITKIKARIAANENFLDIVPFHEVNLTRFASWSSVTSSGGNTAATTATVTNQALQDGGTNSRGFVTAVQEGEAYIQARIENDNTGLTDTAEIDPHTPVTTEAYHRSDEFKLTIGSVAPPPDTATVAGEIKVKGGNVKINASAVTVTGSGGAACVKQTDATYNCVLDAGGNGTITFGKYNDEKVTGNNVSVNNHQILPDVFAGAVVTVANDGTLSETTSFAFTGAAVGIITLDVLISD